MPKKGKKSKSKSSGKGAKKSKKEVHDSQILVEPVEPVEPVPQEITYLPEISIPLYQPIIDKDHSEVPLQSLKSDISFENIYHALPQVFQSLEILQVPYVRDEGIKACIKKLGEHFDCKDYKFSLIQFWFLDIITDCLWRAQDEYRFPIEYQKVVLEWILFVFNLIRSPQMNLTRKAIFKVFKEMLLIGEEHIESGCALLPLPQDLFTFSSQEENLESLTSQHSDFSTSSSESNNSSVSLEEDADDGGSYLVINDEQETEFFKLPKQDCRWDEYIASSVDTLSERSVFSSELEAEENKEKAIDNEADQELVGEEASVEIPEILEDMESIHQFYRPTPGTPPRFRSLTEIENESLTEQLTNEEQLIDQEYVWVDTSKEKENKEEKQQATKQQSKPEDLKMTASSNKNLKLGISSRESTGSRPRSARSPTSSKHSNKSLGTIRTSSKNLIHRASADRQKTKSPKELQNEEKKREAEVIKGLFEYNLWEKRVADMNDPKVGWIPYNDQRATILNSQTFDVTDNENHITKEWIKYFTSHKDAIEEIEDNIFINTCVLLAIKQCVFENFYDTFQFKLVKLAFRTAHTVITQKVNDQWFVPKIVKGDFKRPAVKKKKEKKKGKKGKKKSSKGSKKSKKGKKKGSKKSSKKSKSKSSKSSKKGKKKKKEKKKKLTKEEKAELARLKLEEQRRQEELLKQLENKLFMFPLGDAANDEFFMKIFENWVRPPAKGKGKGKKKGKKSKSSKSKSSKSSKRKK